MKKLVDFRDVLILIYKNLSNVYLNNFLDPLLLLIKDSSENCSFLLGSSEGVVESNQINSVPSYRMVYI